MGLLTFKGGIHPKDGKALAKDQPIKELLPLGELVYPLSQHIGAPAQAVVKVGDRVECGQVIAAAADKALSVNIHSPVNGVVTSVDGMEITIKQEGGR
mgnify:CR=1 FL=1